MCLQSNLKSIGATETHNPPRFRGTPSQRCAKYCPELFKTLLMIKNRKSEYFPCKYMLAKTVNQTIPSDFDPRPEILKSCETLEDFKATLRTFKTSFETQKATLQKILPHVGAADLSTNPDKACAIGIRYFLKQFLYLDNEISSLEDLTDVDYWQLILNIVSACHDFPDVAQHRMIGPKDPTKGPKRPYFLGCINRAFRRSWTNIDAFPLDLKSLDVHSKNYPFCPANITRLTELNTLSIIGNIFDHLPPQIGQLKKLTYLFAMQNCLTYLPPEIGELTNLVFLSATENCLRYLPPEIGKLRKLKTLYLEKNYLTDLPKEMAACQNLEHLDLSHNRFTHFPKKICLFTKLGSLSFSHNQLKNIPSEIGNLINLYTLSFSRNNLQSLPLEIGLCTKLWRLLLCANQLASLPDELTNLTKLTELSLSKNKLKKLPDDMVKLRNLEKLHIHTMPSLKLPKLWSINPRRGVFTTLESYRKQKIRLQFQMIKAESECKKYKVSPFFIAWGQDPKLVAARDIKIKEAAILKKEAKIEEIKKAENLQHTKISWEEKKELDDKPDESDSIELDKL